MAKIQTCGEALVRLLHRRGVDTVFGIPGVHTLELYRGLAGNAIRHVLVRHEQGAGFMADGYARISGRPGVCFVITGPGLTNIATAMGQAYSESVPMLVISTVRATADLNNQQGRLHEISDQLAVSAPLCAFAATALTPEQVPDLIDKAFAVFESARPRPVHIEIPLDVMAAAVDGDWQPAAAVPRPLPDPKDLTAAARLLGEARNPVIIAGGGACDGAADVIRLAELLGAPVVTTIAAKGLMAKDHPLSLSSTLPRIETQEFLAEADVVLAIGTELAETDTWVDQLSLPGAVVRIDIDPRQINTPYPAAVGIIGDAAAAVAELVILLTGNIPSDTAATEKRLGDIRRAHKESESPLRKTHRRVLEIMAANLPETAAIFTDMTQIAYSGNEIFQAPRINSWFHPSGFGTLGYAMPAAIGAKLASPSTPIVAVVGDAGFQFTVQELSVAVELGLHVIIILWNNDALGQIRDDMVAQGIEKVGVEQRNPDFGLLAEAYGVSYQQPGDADSLAAALSRAVAEPGPWMIEVRQADFS